MRNLLPVAEAEAVPPAGKLGFFPQPSNKMLESWNIEVGGVVFFLKKDHPNHSRQSCS